MVEDMPNIGEANIHEHEELAGYILLCFAFSAAYHIQL
jgi:hypothetical protein